MPIDTTDDLRSHIELAIQIELSTIPPYLYAMYSFVDQASEPALLIKSIVAEEMLHVALTTNLLLAVGGRPDFTSTRYLPTYPSPLPHHEPPLLMELAPCSIDLIRDVLMRIEQPETHGAPAQPDRFETLGQFYHALENALRELSRRGPLFDNPQIAAQMSDASFYRPVQFDAEDSGGLMLIDDIDSAIDAIEIIVHQGEGLSDERWADPSHQELTHYYKLRKIIDIPEELGEVRPLGRNPTTARYPDEIRPISDLFNASYRYVFVVMDELFSDRPDQSSAVGRLYRLMTGVLSDLGRHLVTRPLPGGEFAAPTFEVFQFVTGQPGKELIEMASRVREEHPELAAVAEAVEAVVG